MLANVLMLCTTNAVAEFVNKLTGERGGEEEVSWTSFLSL